jgi:TPR repeat protein
MLGPPALMLAWQAWRLRREGPRGGRDRLREAAEGGDPEACYRLGLAYRQGSARLPKDDLSAAVWFRRAAEAGHREAMAALGEAYLGGHGVMRDPREAARWAEASRREPASP